MNKITEYQGFTSNVFLYDDKTAVMVKWTGRGYKITSAWLVSELCNFENYPFEKTTNSDNRIKRML